MSWGLNTANGKILDVAIINCCKSKKNHKVTVYELDPKGILSETPSIFSL